MCLECIVGNTCRRNSSQHIQVTVLVFSCSTQREALNSVTVEFRTVGFQSRSQRLVWRLEEVCVTGGEEGKEEEEVILPAVGINHGAALYVLLLTEAWYCFICLVTDWAMVLLYLSCCYKLWYGFISLVTDWAMVRLYVLLPTEVIVIVLVMLILRNTFCDLPLSQFWITFEGTQQDVSIRLQLIQRS